jgi:hypothetical protein
MSKNKYLEVKKYAQRVMRGSKDPQHTFDHLERVRKNALKIVDLMAFKNIDTNLLQAICLLHDVPVTLFSDSPAVGHFFERIAVKKHLPEVLTSLNIRGNEARIIKEAIYFHNFTIPYRLLNRKGDTYAKVLQDSDSLDYFSKDRERSLEIARNKYPFYFMLSLVSRKFLGYGRAHLGKYLNYQEISDKWTF